MPYYGPATSNDLKCCAPMDYPDGWVRREIGESLNISFRDRFRHLISKLHGVHHGLAPLLGRTTPSKTNAVAERTGAITKIPMPAVDARADPEYRLHTPEPRVGRVMDVTADAITESAHRILRPHLHRILSPAAGAE